LKNEGRKKRNEEIKNEQKTKQQKVEHLKKKTKVSSAQLAAHNHYTLDETVRDMVFKRNAAIEAAHAAVEQRKQEAERKKRRPCKLL
jgi:cystathionine beta-lyase family protein involved in aluminum resistance